MMGLFNVQKNADGVRDKKRIAEYVASVSAGEFSPMDIFIHAPMPVCTVNKRGRIGGANPAFARDFPSLAKKKFKNYDWFAHFHKENVTDGHSAEDLQQCLAPLHQGVQNFLELSMRFDETNDFYRISFFSANHVLQGLVAVFHNISAEYRLREKLSGAAAREAIGQLVGGIAHDFNNMITATKGSIEALLEIIPPRSPGYTDLQMIEQSCVHAAQFTTQIMGLSRDIKSEYFRLDFSPLLESMEPLLFRVFQSDIPVEIYHDAENSHIWGNEVQIEQMVLNIALNARDAMKQYPGNAHKFLLKTCNKKNETTLVMPNGILYAGDYLCVELSDTGGGIADDVMRHVFEPFYTTKDVGQGTGLGLSMVNSITQQMGGCVFVKNREAGAVFSLYFKLAQMQKNDAQLTGAAAVIAQKNKVLLVDDEPSVRFFTAKILRKYGYEVMEAENGVNALKIARAEMPDLLVTDIQMPHMTGVELIKEIKKLNNNLPAVGISGFVRGADFENIAHMPHIYFIAKPFNTHQLKDKIENILCTAYAQDLENDAKLA